MDEKVLHPQLVIDGKIVKPAPPKMRVVPFTRDLFGWLQAQTFAKLVKLPNAAAGEG